MSHYQETLEFSLGVPFTHNNDIRILQNGDEIFPEMLSAIDDARHTIDFLTFVYWKGSVADKFAAALSRAAQRQVTVRVLLDAFGAKTIDTRLLAEMAAAGVEVRWFRPLSTWRIWKVDKRTHRKILICDHKTGFTGGVGIAEEWSGDARKSSEWRDTHVCIEGPAIPGLRAAFVENWNEAGDWVHEQPPEQVNPGTGDQSVMVLRSASTAGWSDIASLTRTLIAIATDRVFIVTAYFSPDPTLLSLLCEAAARGVSISIMVPGQYTDSRLSMLAGQVHYQALLDCGVEILQYQKTLLHIKALIIDYQIVSLGSANMNHRSFNKDEECNIVIDCKKIASDLTEVYRQDATSCTKLESKSWKQRSRTEKLKERFARLLVEQLR